MTVSPLRQTALSDWHQSHGGRLVDFAGWAMPVQYGSIVEEHVATRTAVGLFDVSHMGRLAIEGPAAEAWLDRLTTRAAAGTPIGRVRYSLVCNEAGGVLDDILFTRVSEDRFDLVVNASNREKLLGWFATHAAEGAQVIDQTESSSMIAVQGPGAVSLVASLTGVDAPADVTKLGYYRAIKGPTRIAGVPCVVSRTGYTGEDGFELVCPADDAHTLWDALVTAGGRPCGLAARDTLRLEAGMPLYGHELNEDLTPIHAGLGFAVNFASKEGSPRDFLGAESCAAAAEDESLPKRVGLRVEGRRPPREEYSVLAEGSRCGLVTSGAPSPTLGYPIAMAYVDARHAEEGSRVAIDIRGTETPAEVVPLPFYKRS